MSDMPQFGGMTCCLPETGEEEGHAEEGNDSEEGDDAEEKGECRQTGSRCGTMLWTTH